MIQQHDGDAVQRHYRAMAVPLTARRNCNLIIDTTTKDRPSMYAHISCTAPTAKVSTRARTLEASNHPMRTLTPYARINTWSLNIMLSRISRPKSRFQHHVSVLLLWIMIVVTDKATAFSVQQHNIKNGSNNNNGHNRQPQLPGTFSGYKIPGSNTAIRIPSHFVYRRPRIVPSRWRSSLQASASPGETSLLSFDEGDVGIARHSSHSNTQSFFSLYYRIYNNNNGNETSKTKETPLVVLHGGPSLPSQYLYPLVENLDSKRRPVLFYDQLGCGKSDEPKQKEFYSISQSVSDLDTVLDTLYSDPTQKVHLMGHSYGGCLAYEFAKQQPDRLASLVLCSTPTNMKLAGDSYDRLALQNPIDFWKNHVSSVSSPALDDALKHVGHVWSGIDVVMNYVATPPMKSESVFPNTLVISGVNDFAFESSRGWKEVIGGHAALVEDVCLEHCAHYPHLEDGAKLGCLLDAFLSKHDQLARRKIL